jgi:hypothetical protein
MVLILKEAEERFRNELMDDEERMLLHDRIIRLKTKLASLPPHASCSSSGLSECPLGPASAI